MTHYKNQITTKRHSTYYISTWIGDQELAASHNLNFIFLHFWIILWFSHKPIDSLITIILIVSTHVNIVVSHLHSWIIMLWLKNRIQSKINTRPSSTYVALYIPKTLFMVQKHQLLVLFINYEINHVCIAEILYRQNKLIYRLNFFFQTLCNHWFFCCKWKCNKYVIRKNSPAYL